MNLWKQSVTNLGSVTFTGCCPIRYSKLHGLLRDVNRWKPTGGSLISVKLMFFKNENKHGVVAAGVVREVRGQHGGVASLHYVELWESDLGPLEEQHFQPMSPCSTPYYVIAPPPMRLCSTPYNAPYGSSVSVCRLQDGLLTKHLTK